MGGSSIRTGIVAIIFSLGAVSTTNASIDEYLRLAESSPKPSTTERTGVCPQVIKADMDNYVCIENAAYTITIAPVRNQTTIAKPQIKQNYKPTPQLPANCNLKYRPNKSGKCVMWARTCGYAPANYCK